MEYKVSEIPEIMVGQAILSQATDVSDKIEDFNALYFADKPYSLYLTGNFDPSYPMVDIEIATDAPGGGYGFSIFGLHSKETFEGLIIALEQMLREGTLFSFMLMNCFDRTQQLARQNFMKYIVKA